MSDNTTIEWTDATFRAMIWHGKQNWRDEIGRNAVWRLFGDIYRQDIIWGKMVHSLQSVAHSFCIWAGYVALRRSFRSMRCGAIAEGQRRLSAQSATQGWKPPLCAFARRRQGAGAAQDQLPAKNGGNTRPEHAPLLGLRAYRVGGAS